MPYGLWLPSLRFLNILDYATNSLKHEPARFTGASFLKECARDFNHCERAMHDLTTTTGSALSNVRPRGSGWGPAGGAFRGIVREGALGGNPCPSKYKLRMPGAAVHCDCLGGVRQEGCGFLFGLVLIRESQRQQQNLY